MNSDEIKSLIVKILMLIITPIATKCHISGDLSYAVAADVADLAVVAYGVYDHWNKVKVQEPTTTK